MRSLRRPPLSRLPHADLAFDAGVLLLGVAIALVSVTVWLQQPLRINPAALVAVALVPAISRFPFVLSQKAGDSNIGLDPAALVFLTLTGSAARALSLWAAGQLISQLLSDRSLRVRVFNFGITVTAGSLFVLLVHWPYRGSPDRPGMLAMVIVGCVAYFVTDIYLTAVSLAVETRRPIRDALSWHAAPMALLVCVGIDMVGYLAAVMSRRLPGWTLLLLLIPIITIVVSVRSVSRSQLAHAQLTGLLDATTDAPEWARTDQVEAALVEHAERVVRLSTAVVRDAGPGPEEIGAAVASAGRQRWLVCERTANAEPFSVEDQQSLSALCSVANTSLSRRLLADDMAHQARHDTLTGLANRASFSDRLEHALQRRRREPGLLLAVLYLDLDGFKHVNDRLGHHAGDQVLVAVAERITSCLRPADTAARLGGDEFAVLLEELPGPGAADQAAERLLAALRAPVVLDGRPTSVRASIGLAYPDGQTTAAELLRLADGAMYRAKTDGRDRLATFQPTGLLDGTRRLQVEDRLRHAIADGLIRAAYQPTVDLHDGCISGFEALARWDDPVLGPVGPDVFIPMAEQLDLIDALGRHMLSTAHEAGVHFTAVAGRPISMSVNLAPSQVFDQALLALVTELRGRHPQVPLTLEVTERTMLGHDQQTLSTLAALRSAGVQLAVDDFGIGYSSIGYLRRFELDVLKIDKSFVQSLHEPGAHQLTVGMVALAQAMQLTAVAEGVETLEQAEVLRAMGCPYGQGYLFARPMTRDRAAELVRHGQVVPVAPPESGDSAPLLEVR